MKKRNVGDETEVGTIVSEKLAFDNKFFSVIERVVKTPDGSIRAPQLLWDRQGKNFAVAVVITTDNKFVFVREPKYGQMETMLSLPTGGVQKGESPLLAAQREFREETGYEADNWTALRDGMPVIDFADKTDGGEHYFFFGINARKVGEPEREVVLLSEKDSRALIHRSDSQLKIAMSIVGLILVMTSGLPE